MRIRFKGGEDAAERLSQTIENELNALPQDREIEIGADRITAERLRSLLSVEPECCLFIEDEMPPEVFGYMMFVLSMNGFSIEESEIIEHRKLEEQCAPEFLLNDEEIDFMDDLDDIF